MWDDQKKDDIASDDFVGQTTVGRQADELLDKTWLDAPETARTGRGTNDPHSARGTGNPAKTAVIIRYSPRAQESEESVERQLETCLRYIREKGWPMPDPERIYIDRMASGAYGAIRPRFEDMFADLENGGHTFAVGESADRLTRDLGMLARAHKLYEHHGGELHFCDRGKLNTASIAAHGFLSMEQRSLLRARTMAGRRQAAAEGRWVGKVPYGYRAMPGTRGVLVVDKTEAQVVRRIFRQYAAGASVWSIVVALNREGIPSANGKLWSGTVISGRGGLLGRWIYAGIKVFGTTTSSMDPSTGRYNVREVPRDDWNVMAMPALAIVEKDLFGRVQRMLRTERKPRRERAGSRGRLLTGLVFCSCGSRMQYSGEGRSNAPMLSCTAAATKGVCTEASATRKAAYVEKDVLRMLRDDLLARTSGKVAAAFDRSRADLARENERKRKELEERCRRLEHQLELSFDPVHTAGLGEERLTGLRGRLEREAEALREAVAELDAALLLSSSAPKDLSTIQKAVSALIERTPFEVRDEADGELRNAFQGLVEHIELRFPKNARGYRIRIKLRGDHRNADGSPRLLDRTFDRYRDGFRDDPGRFEAARTAAENGTFALADEDWDAIEHLFRDHRHYRLEPRRLVDALLFHAWTLVPLTRTPACFGDSATLRNGAFKTVSSGAWDRLVEILAEAQSPVIDGIDATVFDRWKTPATA